jgi:hypothetical protein
VTRRSHTSDPGACATEKGAASGQLEDGGLGGFLRSLLAGIPWSESASAEDLLCLPQPRGKSIAIHNPHGRTFVIGEERDDIEVKVLKHARAESAEAAQAMVNAIYVSPNEGPGALELEVEIPSRWNRYGSANLELRVPRKLEVTVTAANGKVTLKGLRCRVNAHSSNGSVSIRDVVGDLNVFTSNAKICCASTCGQLVARSSNGKIEIGGHSGSLDASTSNGLIRANLDRLGDEGVVLTTSNGRIVLELPEDVNAEVDVRVDNGVIHNSLALNGQSRVTTGRVRGRLGRGGTPIKLRTSNGMVSLR